jgi:hypothetical protein
MHFHASGGFGLGETKDEVITNLRKIWNQVFEEERKSMRICIRSKKINCRWIDESKFLYYSIREFTGGNHLEHKTRTIRIPGDVVELMGPVMSREKIDFDNFVLDAIRNYIQVIKYRDGIDGSYGAWVDSSHPELSDGIDHYIREMRKGRNL